AADLGANFTDLARELGDRLAARGIASAWHARADLVAGLLALPGDTDAGTAADVAGTVEHPLRLGLSLRVNGLGEVDEGFRQATLALRTLTGPGVVALRDRMPEALLVDAPRLSARLVELWLGPLLRLPPGERDVLLATLEHWVASHGSPARAAELAHCHRNTVLNRLRRVETLTGQALPAGHVSLELALALRAHRLP
ncbi:MAG: PucR family transcriptional regulator, partial [Nocardioidaceae bacterium]